MPGPEEETAARVAWLEARCFPQVMIWDPATSASGNWEAMSDDGWLIEEEEPSRFCDLLEDHLAFASAEAPAAGGAGLPLTAGPEDAGEPDDDLAPLPADEWEYRVVADRLAVRIKRGEFSATGRFPTRAEVAGHYGIGPGTARHVWDELKQRGLIHVVQGRGTFTT